MEVREIYGWTTSKKNKKGLAKEVNYAWIASFHLAQSYLNLNSLTDQASKFLFIKLVAM